MKVRIGSIEVEVFEPLPGFRVISALAHPIIFEDGGEIHPNPEVAKLIKATLKEKVVEGKKELGVVLVRTVPVPDPEVEIILGIFAQDNPDIYIISSILSVEAYRGMWPFPVVISPVTTPETARSAPELKRCYRNKWAC